MKTTSKTSRASKKVSTKRVSKKADQSELDLLREQNALLMARLEALETNHSKGDVTEVKETKIPLDDLITIMSLISYPLILSTKPQGQGSNFRFDGFGQVKQILYSDLLQILEVDRHFMEAGLFAILDKRVIKTHGLQDAYTRILTKEKIDEILSGSKNAVELYQSCNPKQQEEIVSMIIDKLAEDAESIDLNVVSRLTRVSGINIEERVKDTREYLEMRKETSASQ